MHDDLGLLSRSTEAVADEIDFGFHHGEIVLCAALQDETGSQCSEIGNAGNIKEHILWQHCRETGQNFLCLPTLALKVDDVRLHEYGTAVAEDGHGFRGNGKISIRVHVDAESFRRRL